MLGNPRGFHRGLRTARYGGGLPTGSPRGFRWLAGGGAGFQSSKSKHGKHNFVYSSLMASFRVRTVMENLEKSWNFKMVISRPGGVMEKT